MKKCKFYELSNAQKNILDTELYFSSSNLNNMGGYVFINEKVNFEVLENAINIYINKNDALRLKICKKGDNYVQYLENNIAFHFDIVNVKNKTELEKLSQNLLEEPFTLLDSFLFSFTFFKLPSGFGGFNVMLHHFISDAWNMGLLISEIMNLYSELLDSKSINLEPNPSYLEYIESQNNYIVSDRYKKDKQFWNNYFSNEPQISLLSNKKMSKIATKAKRKTFTLPVDLYSKISDFSKEVNCSAYTFFMAVFSLYLSKINNTNEPIIGTPILNRSGFKEKSTAGMFVSTVPFKVSINLNDTFEKFLIDVSHIQLSIFKHQKYPYMELLKSIKNKYNLTENLYDLVISYQNARNNNGSSKVKYYSKWVPNNNVLESLEIHFYDMDNTGVFDINYDYQVEKFTEEEIIRIHNNILFIINQVLNNKYITLHDIDIVNLSEQCLIKEKFNDTFLENCKNIDILKIFEKNVIDFGTKTALIFEDTLFTYKGLNKLVNQMANYLSSLNLPKNTIIGLRFPRSFNTIICMLAAMKTGFMYMLIEKDIPIDRVLYMLNNSNSSLLITSKDLDKINYKKEVYIENISLLDFPDDYIPEPSHYNEFISVVYTSGSTGTPKGVIIKRSSIVNLVEGYKYSMQADKLDIFLSICSVAFDMFAAEVWISILLGKTLVLANEDESKNPIALSSLIDKYSCEFMLITSSKLDLLLTNAQTYKCLKNLKAIQLGGQVLSESFYNKLIKYTNATIYNGYGPSETTSCCSCKKIVDSKDITLGTPLPNVQIYICNKDLSLLPIGTVGELCIAGQGVSAGYINNKSLTNKVFVKNPFGKGLLYKSGDLAKWNNNGDLIYIGRNDFQIKIRGLRIELEEINKILSSIPYVKDSITVIKKVNNIDTICSYVVSEKEDPKEIKNLVSKKLPHYMVPSCIVFMHQLPLTTNGKIDTKNLPEIKINKTYIKPSTTTEMFIQSIFEKHFRISPISVKSDFFELGGDSLIAIKIMIEINSKYNISLEMRDIFKYTTINELSSYIDQYPQKENLIKFQHSKIKNKYTATSSQKGIFFTVYKENANISYNTPGCIIFHKPIEPKKIELAITTLIKRHESLRTYFSFDGDSVSQIVLKNLNYSLDISNELYSNLDITLKDFVSPFDLTKAPLFRTKFIKFENKDSALLVDFHHIICDGASISIFLNELICLLNDNPLPKKDFDFRDFSVWEEKYTHTSSFIDDKSYWLNRLGDDLPSLSLTEHSRSLTLSNTAQHINSYFYNIDTISSICKSLNVTTFSLLITIYYILLYKYTNQNDLIVGTPSSGRKFKEITDIIGMFVNTIPLRNNVDSSLTFSQLVHKIQKKSFEDFEHENYHFEQLVKDLNISRESNRNPIFDTMFSYQSEDLPIFKLKNQIGEYYNLDSTTSKFDFMLEITSKENYLKLNLEYNDSLFTDSFMNNFMKHYLSILNICLNNINIKISDINMLSKDELSFIQSVSNNTLKYPRNSTIIELFEKEVNRVPNSIAVKEDGGSLTYQALYNKVNALAFYLNRRGVSKGDIVGTLLNRSSNLIISILAILKCGAIYLPISTDFPKERIEYIIKNSKLHTIISNKSSLDISFYGDLINIDSLDLNFIPDPMKISYDYNDGIYTIYTSGTTGNPKGVLVSNKNLNNFIHSFKYLFDNSVNENDICIASTSISFDVSIWEIFFTLLNGACLYLYKDNTIEDIIDFCNTLVRENITLAYLPPNILNEVYSLLSNKGISIPLEKVLLGVEPIKVNTICKFYNLNPNIKFVNGYGPTETTICSTAFAIKNIQNIPYNIIPIGKPLPNLKAYILDKDLNPVPVGVPGELYISGDNVSKGYLFNDVLTNKKYLKCPFNNKEIMYSTGDLVKLLPDKNLMFVGRDDGQIKIKGHRIELNEITNAILSFPFINKCSVLLKEKDNNKYLVAYFTSEKKVSLTDLRSFLALKLPFYSIPNYFVHLDKFVLTANGKIDKNHLSSIELKENVEYEAPRNKFEKDLISLWESFLNVDKIGINDNFFDLGGDSLIAIKLQIEAFSLGLNISYSDIFSYPTIKQLSNKVSLALKNTHQKDLSTYDYSKINTLLCKNTKPISYNKKPRNLDNILLTGATGFVGIHILEKLLLDTNSTIYCLVRNKNNISYSDRLVKVLNFYFGDKYDKLVGNRIKLIQGDISKENLGLTDFLYNNLGLSLSCFINSAAIVKHYGDSSVFDKINIGGVQNIIKFCENFNIKLYHLSTLSVSGNVFLEDNFSGSTVVEKTDFDETKLYINQNISNVYVSSKFIAERCILEHISNNSLEATIIRLGNITNRFSDGKFQINISENAFLNRILSFINLGCIPDYLLNGYGEFTPVDYVANAISIIIRSDTLYSVLHLYNNNHITMIDFVNLLNDYGLNIDILSEKDFLTRVNNTLKSNKNALSGIINDFNENKKLVYDSNIILHNTFTNEFLNSLGFSWCEIEKNYIFNYLNYLKNSGYLRR